MASGNAEAFGIGNSVKTPAGVRRPILLLARSVNQRLPSGPAVMNSGMELAVGMGNSSVTTPEVVMRPILLVLPSVNQSAPSGPTAMPKGRLEAVGHGYSVMPPSA